MHQQNLNRYTKGGKLTKDKIIFESTSGNTGITLGMIDATKDYQITLVMPDGISVERQHILETFGAKIILTPGCDGTNGTIHRAHKLLDDNLEIYFLPNQFDNENNVLAHYETTGLEIFTQTDR